MDVEDANHIAQGVADVRHPNDTAALFVHRGKSAVGWLVQHLLGHNQSQELRGIGGGHNARWDAKLDWVEAHIVEEGTTASVGLIRCAQIGIVVVIDEPVRLWNVSDQVFCLEDILPESGLVLEILKEGADAYNGDGLVFLCHGLTSSSLKVGSMMVHA